MLSREIEFNITFKGEFSTNKSPQQGKFGNR